jgi:lysyl-tRNA synthetase class 2
MPAGRSMARGWRATAAVLLALAALGMLAGVLLPSPRWEPLGRLAVDPAPLTALSNLLATVAGVGLLLVARGLWRGSRRAAQLAAGALALAALTGLAGGSAVETVIEAALCALLIARLNAFPRGAATAVPRLAAVLAAAATGTGYALAVTTVLVADQVTGLSAALQAAAAWLLAGTWWLTLSTPVALALHAAVIVAVGAAAWWLHVLLRPGRADCGHTASDHERAASIVAAYASDSLDPFALREDKNYYFAHGGLLAYRTLRETAVVSGDPIGPPGRAPAILAAFAAAAAARGWDVVVTAASERHLAGYRALGLRTLCVGEEGVVDTARFSLEGSAMKSVRKAVRRVERHGWAVEVLTGRALSVDAVRAIDRLERAWRSSRPRLQGFAMTLGRLWGAQEDEDAVYVLGRDPGGELQAFLRFDRYPGGLSLDVMRRVGTEPNGVNEALIVAAIAYARAQGLAHVSLNFAGFSHILAPRGPLTRAERLSGRLLRLAHGRFQLDRLARFNQKFGPEWEARYLVYHHALGLPRAALRVLQAEAYVRAPRERHVHDRWRPAAAPISAGGPAAIPRP